jgi:hypothetical protein
MSVSVKTYILSIINLLTKVVLPALDSKFARIQLSFAIDMLNQLQNRLEYRNDVIKDDYETAKEILNLVCAALNANNVAIPEEIISNLKATSASDAPILPLAEDLSQTEAASAGAVDLLYEKKNEITNFNEVEQQLLSLSLQWGKRKATLQAPTINLELLESE